MVVRFREIEKDGQLFVEEIHKVVVHQFTLGDVEDPELYAAEPIINWQKSAAGTFVMNNAIDVPMFQQIKDNLAWGYKYVIIAELEKKKLSEFYLKFGNGRTRDQF